MRKEREVTRELLREMKRALEGILSENAQLKLDLHLSKINSEKDDKSFKTCRLRQRDCQGSQVQEQITDQSTAVEQPKVSEAD